MLSSSFEEVDEPVSEEALVPIRALPFVRTIPLLLLPVGSCPLEDGGPVPMPLEFVVVAEEDEDAEDEALNAENTEFIVDDHGAKGVSRKGSSSGCTVAAPTTAASAPFPVLLRVVWR